MQYPRTIAAIHHGLEIELQLALAQLNTAHGTDFSMVMAGTLLAVVPLVVIFVFFARNFIADATKGAVRE